jgi:hypothetical protein
MIQVICAAYKAQLRWLTWALCTKWTGFLINFYRAGRTLWRTRIIRGGKKPKIIPELVYGIMEKEVANIFIKFFKILPII